MRSAWSHLRSPILVPVRTGILGGTFDPIHLAHLHAAETAMHQANLDRLLFIPAGDPWQKRDRRVSAPHHRVAMVDLAISEGPGFELDRQEIERVGPTYTIDTLQTFPESEDLYLLMGADAALGFDTWHQADLVLERAGVLVVPRPGADSTAAVDWIPGARLLDMAPLGVSSTLIRAMARCGRPFRYLVPGAVHEYIVANNLYPEGENDDMVEQTTTEESSS